MFEISTVLITGTALFLACVMIGAIWGPPMLDERSRLFGAWIGLVLGGFLSGTVMAAMVVLHFLSKSW